MLRLLLSVVLLVSTGGLFATTSKAEEQTEELFITKGNSERVTFEELSEEQKQAFIADGYNEVDKIIETTLFFICIPL